jgi:RNA chaperone Hfq
MSDITIQESFFGSALQHGRHVTVYLLSGVKVSGVVNRFDKYSLVLETEEDEHLIFKHSISAAFLCRKKDCLSCSPDQEEDLPILRASGD